MPLYTYECPRCRSRVDIIRSLSDRDELPLCVEPGCEGTVEMERMMAAPAAHFKGTGWTPKHYNSNQGSEWE